MIIRRPPEIPSSEITPEDVYVNRRRFIKAAAVGAAGLAVAPFALRGVAGDGVQEIPPRFRTMRSELDEELNEYKDVTEYNNFYEFGTDKRDPHRNSGDFNPRPWKVTIGGEVAKPGDYDLDDILSGVTMEDRVYRLRCVEAWSMVIPWYGFPLSTLINRVEPTSKANFIRFKTVVRPSEMIGQRRGRGTLNWPYVEGLRMDEAMHPLTILVTGVYGMDLPNQNGAPLRLIIPWKYGFKGLKSIVSIDFVERMPLNTWQRQNSFEYGFYANVNPNVSHPRWSQARERRLPQLRKNHETLMFNGYADQVAHLYDGMDLERWK